MRKSDKWKHKMRDMSAFKISHQRGHLANLTLCKCKARVTIEDFKWGASAHQQHWLCGTGSQNVKQVFPTLLGGVGLGRATWRDQTVKYWRYIATPGKALPVLSKKTQNMFWHLSTFPLIWAFLPFEAAAVRSRSFQASQGNCMGSRNAYIPYFPTWQCVCYPTCQLRKAYATLLPSW